MDAQPKPKRSGRRATAAPFRIRPARAADVAQIAPIERAAFSDPWSDRDFSDCLATGIPFLVTEVDGAVAGYVIAHHGADQAEILNVGVTPERRRQGIGRALIEAMLALLAQRGVVTVFLEVRESNVAAQHLYAALGFERVGRRLDYYRLPKEDAVILRASIASGAEHA